MNERRVRIEINGQEHERLVEPRMLLSDFIRHEARLTGTHVGCEHGVCGACTVQVDGDPVRSCLIFAIQADGLSLRTVEGMTEGLGDDLHPLQQAFHETHALQCGFCTPGMIMAAVDLLKENPNPTEHEIREGIEGNLCRCTGYQNIVSAIQQAAGQSTGGAA